MDLVQKLRARGLLGDAVIHTATGREYLTKEHLREQVRGMWEGPSRRKETQSNGTHAHATARFACLEERREKTDASLVSTNQVGSSLLSAGGRLSLVDAAAAAGVDLAYVEEAADALVATGSEQKTALYQGDLVTEAYYASVAAEVDELLAEHGRASIPELAQAFNLSAELMRRVIEAHLGSAVHGHLEGNLLYTAAHVAALRAQVVGGLRALGRPTALATLEAYVGGDRSVGSGGAVGGGSALFRAVAADVMGAAGVAQDLAGDASGHAVAGATPKTPKSSGRGRRGKGRQTPKQAAVGTASSPAVPAVAAASPQPGSSGGSAARLAGTPQGGGGTWVPRVYSLAQREAAEAFYQANGLIEYAQLSAMQVADPAGYMSARYPDGLALESCYVGPSVLGRAEAVTEEELRSQGWCTLASCVPEALSEADAALMAARVAARDPEKAWHVVAGSSLVTRALRSELREAVVEFARSEGLRNAAAQPSPAAAQAAPSPVTPAMAPSKRDDSDDEWDTGRSKGKKGRRSGKKGRASATPGSARGSKTPQSSSSGGGAEAGAQSPAAPSAVSAAIIRARIAVVRPDLGGAHDEGASNDLVEALAEELVRPALDAYNEGKKSALSAGADARRRARAALNTELSNRWVALQLGARGAALFAADGAEGVHFARHVLKTCGADAVDSLLRLAVLDEAVQSGHGLEDEGLAAGRGALQPRERADMAKRTGAAADALCGAVAALGGSSPTAEALLEALEAASRECGLSLRPMDKKAERQAVHAKCGTLASSLEREAEPAAALAAAVQLLYAQRRGVVLQAPGKKLGVAIEALRGVDGVDGETVDVLLAFHGDVVALLVARARGEEGAAHDAAQRLEEQMPAMKRAAHSASCASDS